MSDNAMAVDNAMKGMYLSGAADAYESALDATNRYDGDKLRQFFRGMCEQARAEAQSLTGVAVEPFMSARAAR